MQKIVFSFFFLSMFLLAESTFGVEEFMVLKTENNSFTVDDIRKKDTLFEDLEEQAQLDNRSIVYWLKIKFRSTMPSGKYLISYIAFDFDLNSFSSKQRLNKYISNKVAVFSFEYNKNRDSRTYYFRLINCIKYEKPSVTIDIFDSYYQEAVLKPDSKWFFLLFGSLSGLIFMVSIYNLAIYYFSRERSFLYYALMEFFMILIMMYQMGIISLEVVSFNTVSLFSAMFATLFMRSFLETAQYLPKLDKALQFYQFLIFLDLIFLHIYHYSIIANFALYSLFGVIYFIVGFLRLKQGFLPAKFFLLGWSMLVISIFYAEHIGNIYGLSSLLFGPPLEAIILAIALAYKLKLLLDEKKEQQELLVHQSKLASMGEMIGNISHQWKQPLSYLAFNFMNIREADKRNLLDSTYLNKKLDKADAQLDFMSQTMENFKDFYLPNKEKELFSLHEASLETLEIMSYQFKQYSIEVLINVEEDKVLNSYKNEYKQVFLNLLTNAKDAFLQRKIVKPKIGITFKKNIVIVADNAGGIPPEILKRIYEPYFTTKEGNSGIGLYMSKMIVEKNMNGRLNVSNTEEGAVFRIIF